MRYVLVHGLGLSSVIWSRLAPLLNDEVVAIDLPGHGCSTLTVYDWQGIWNSISDRVRRDQWEDTTLVLHSFSAALLPEIVASSVQPNKVILIEGIVHRDDAVWTSELTLLDEVQFASWLSRFRSVAKMTLKSQLVHKHNEQDIILWSNGFKSVAGEALRIMAYNLVQRVRSQVISDALNSVCFPIIYITGARSRLSESGLSFLESHSVEVAELNQSGHFPMLDNPVGLKTLITQNA
ncbi:MAG: alpha/beta hydrolase [Gammaproteobacteria bacterium]|nr:alpha/beta hydrolase [Gammaproteobacteria bacterium]